MAIKLISEEPLEENAALFENDAVSGEDNGSIEWEIPFLENGAWKVTFEGLDVEGTVINSTTVVIPLSETINPTKVFWWLANKAKEILCPTCI